MSHSKIYDQNYQLFDSLQSSFGLWITILERKFNFARTFLRFYYSYRIPTFHLFDCFKIEKPEMKLKKNILSFEVYKSYWTLFRQTICCVWTWVQSPCDYEMTDLFRMRLSPLIEGKCLYWKWLQWTVLGPNYDR